MTAPLSEYFAAESHPPLCFDSDENEDDLPDESLRALDINEMIYKLGLPPLKLQNNYKAELVSDKYPIGWALYHRDIGLARHTVFEIGDDKHHVRIDIKDCFNGDPYKVQIDQVVIWDKDYRHVVPLSPEQGAFEYEDNYMLPYLEDIIGTVDLATQALSNGDDGQAYKAFSDIGRIKRELGHVLSMHCQTKIRHETVTSP